MALITITLTITLITITSITSTIRTLKIYNSRINWNNTRESVLANVSLSVFFCLCASLSLDLSWYVLVCFRHFLCVCPCFSVTVSALASVAVFLRHCLYFCLSSSLVVSIIICICFSPSLSMSLHHLFLSFLLHRVSVRLYRCLFGYLYVSLSVHRRLCLSSCPAESVLIVCSEISPRDPSAGTFLTTHLKTVVIIRLASEWRTGYGDCPRVHCP